MRRCFRRRTRSHVRGQLGTALASVCLVIGLLGPQSATAQVLESPVAQTTVSGIDTVFGWVCNASSVQLLFDGTRRLDAVYGSPRVDTAQACGGKTNNGFVALVNWNDLGRGPHTVALCVDNVCGQPIPVFVNTFGESVLRGRSFLAPACTNQVTPPFPGPVLLIWEERRQNFSIALAATCTELLTLCSPLPAPNTGERQICDALLPCCR